MVVNLFEEIEENLFMVPSVFSLLFVIWGRYLLIHKSHKNSNLGYFAVRGSDLPRNIFNFKSTQFQFWKFVWEYVYCLFWVVPQGLHPRNVEEFHLEDDNSLIFCPQSSV